MLYICMLGCSVFIQIKIQLITHGSNWIDSCKTLLSEAASKVHSLEKLFIESNCKSLRGGAIRSTNLFNFAKQPYWGKAPHWAFCGWSHNEEPYFNMVA